MTDMVKALAHPDQPQATCAALEAQVKATVGAKLFTIMALDHDAQLARRCYSNMPEAYPTSAAKPMIQDAWAEQVIARQQPFVGNSIDALAEVFPDHPLIRSLGCESCLNIPIVIAGKVAGTLNCLHDAGYYTPERVRLAERVKEAGALALLLVASLERSQ